MAASLRHRGPDAQRGAPARRRGARATPGSPSSISEGGRPAHAGPGDRRHRSSSTARSSTTSSCASELARGYPFRTRSDTEVILAAYLALGHRLRPRAERAVRVRAVGPARRATLWLARDRVGICRSTTRDAATASPSRRRRRRSSPGGFVAARRSIRGGSSRAPALGAGRPADLPSRACSALPPASRGAVRRRATRGPALLGPRPRARARTRTLDGRARSTEARGACSRTRSGCACAPTCRWRAYLSGGLDSSLVCALAQRAARGNALHLLGGLRRRERSTSGRYQREVARRAADAPPRRAVATSARSGSSCPTWSEHAEQVLVRARRRRRFLRALASSVRGTAAKVVLTGEGSDEIFLGYDLYAETQVRAFWARRPGVALAPGAPAPPLSVPRPRPAGRRRCCAGLLRRRARPARAPAFSHLVRWAASGRVAALPRPRARARARPTRIPSHPCRRAPGSESARGGRSRAPSTLEMQTLLAGYLLSAQGDRMLMATLGRGAIPVPRPPAHRARGAAARPAEARAAWREVGAQAVRARARAARRARAHRSSRTARRWRRRSWADAAPAGRASSCPRGACRQAGVFDPHKVDRLVRKLAARGPARSSEADAMAITAVATGQLLAAWLSRRVRPDRLRRRVVGRAGGRVTSRFIQRLGARARRANARRARRRRRRLVRLTYGDARRARPRPRRRPRGERASSAGDRVLVALPTRAAAAVVDASRCRRSARCAVEVDRDWGAAALRGDRRRRPARATPFVAGRDAPRLGRASRRGVPSTRLLGAAPRRGRARPGLDAAAARHAARRRRHSSTRRSRAPPRSRAARRRRRTRRRSSSTRPAPRAGRAGVVQTFRQHRRQHALDRRVPRARPRRPRDGHPARSTTATDGASCRRTSSSADRSSSTTAFMYPRVVMEAIGDRGLHRLRRRAAHVRDPPAAGGRRAPSPCRASAT